MHGGNNGGKNLPQMKTTEMMKVIEIQNFEAPELDVYARLTENQLVNRADPAKGMFIAESPKVIMRALDAGCVPVSVLMEKRQLETEGEALEAIRMCSSTNKEFPVYVAEFEVLAKLTGFQLTRGMLCAMYRPKLRTPQEICRDARRIAVLENVVNPTNVGAIFRSAAALNMDAVLLTPACSDPLYRRAIRVSMGTVFQTWDNCGRWAFRRLPWHFGKTLLELMTKDFMQWINLRYCWETREKDWPMRHWHSATIRCAYR